MVNASEVAQASAVRLVLDFDKIPMVSCARKYGEQWTFAGGAFDNCEYFGSQVHFASRLTEMEQMLLFDPQTSGGLLMAVPPQDLERFLDEAALRDQPVWVIGEVAAGTGIEVS